MTLLDMVHKYILFAQARNRNDLTLYLRGSLQNIELPILGITIETVVIDGQGLEDQWAMLNIEIMPIKEGSAYIAIIGQNSSQWAIYIKPDLSIEGTNEYGLPITDWQRS